MDGWQTELPDTWLPGGGIWLQQVPESSVEVRFGGHIEEQWHNQYHSVRHKDYTSITAIPYDMCIAGMDGKGISLLRVWKAENDKFDMKLFNGGNYMRAMEQQAMSEIITKVLYPEDNHTDGKLLRLSQQYFLVSASIQDIIRRHLYAHGNLDKLPELAAIRQWAEAQPGAQAALMSGSGSATFVCCESFAAATALVSSARAQGWWSRATSFSPLGATLTPLRR